MQSQILLLINGGFFFPHPNVFPAASQPPTAARIETLLLQIDPNRLHNVTVRLWICLKSHSLECHSHLHVQIVDVYLLFKWFLQVFNTIYISWLFLFNDISKTFLQHGLILDTLFKQHKCFFPTQCVFLWWFCLYITPHQSHAFIHFLIFVASSHNMNKVTPYEFVLMGFFDKINDLL